MTDAISPDAISPNAISPAKSEREASARYRCNTCGNLTRFDVVATRRTKAFHHYSVGGELIIESNELLAEDIESVSCRWCSSDSGVVVVDESGG